MLKLNDDRSILLLRFKLGFDFGFGVEIDRGIVSLDWMLLSTIDFGVWYTFECETISLHWMLLSTIETEFFGFVQASS